MRKGLHQADQIVGKLAGVLPQHHQRSQNALLVDQRHHQHRMETGLDHDVAQRMIRRRVEIGDRDRLAARGGFAERRIVGLDRQVLAFGRLVDADRFGEVEFAVRGVIAVNQHRIGMGDFERARGDRRQHRVEVERGRHRAADLFQHFQLVDRLRQIPRPLLHLGLEAGIGFRQLARHAVELVGELFQLVGVFTSMRWLKSPAPSRCAPARSALIGTSIRRAMHGAGDDRGHEAHRDQKRDAHQLIADRRQRLRRRLLEEHEPAESAAPRSPSSARHCRQCPCPPTAASRLDGGDLRQASRRPCRFRGPSTNSPAPGPCCRRYRQSLSGRPRYRRRSPAGSED